jgi:hypothetical protein
MVKRAHKYVQTLKYCGLQSKLFFINIIYADRSYVYRILTNSVTSWIYIYIYIYCHVVECDYNRILD